MPRSARVVLPNHPHHIVQRGHNRQVLFADERDYLKYLGDLREWQAKLRCKVYAYCLMTNHVHIVVDPTEDPTNLGKLLKRVAGRYTRYRNKTKGLRGTAWEGRFKSSPIESEGYLLACCRYVDLNPVRAGMVASPQQYRWSSYNERAGIRKSEKWLDDDPSYLGLGRTKQERAEAYRLWVRAAIPAGEWELIRAASQRGQLTGSRRFIEEVQRRIGRRIELRGRGRPSKAVSNTKK